MPDKTVNTIIIGAGISGLACAYHLQKHNEDFLVITKNIGGRILTSADGTVNYGAFFVCNDYHHILPFVQLQSRIRLRDFCFHEEKSTYVLFEPKLLLHIIEFIKIIKQLYTFRKNFRTFRKNCLNTTQKKAIQQNPYLHQLYKQNAADFVQQHKIHHVTNHYLSKALYSTTFSKINQMNAFTFMQFLLPLITPIYTFTFKQDKLTHSFQNKILLDTVQAINYTKGRYIVKTDTATFTAKNVVLATDICTSKKFIDIKQINKPIQTNMVHIKGTPNKMIARKKYHLFHSNSNTQAIAHTAENTFLFYHKKDQPHISRYFSNHQTIATHKWDPAGTINGHILLDSIRGNNMYLIGDYNVAGLEESYITGLFCANQILETQKTKSCIK